MNIKSASDLLGISADTIRYYERVGLVHRLLEPRLEFVTFKIRI
ncbi:MerR family regulatory protein [Streptococcus oralis]|nr:MerR family regulatory protein [Streptococcus oralis]